MTTRTLFGIDVGGTKIGVSIGAADDGRVLAAERLATDATRAPDELLDAALDRLAALRPHGRDGEDVEPPDALGIACPGPLSYERGCLLEVPNMPRWQGFPILEYVRSKRPELPVAFMNDANAGVLAEHLWGAARGVSTALFLTMSTGMGCGILLDGRVFEGPLALAGEIGHLRLTADGPVGFGKRGSVEGYLSGPGIAQVARAELLLRRQRGEPDGALATAAADAVPTAEQVCASAAAGDPAALAVVDRCGHELGRLCAWLVDVFNPERIVLGTIGTAHPELWIPRARAVVDAEALPAAAALVDIVPSGLAQRGDQTALAIARRALDATAG